MGAAGQPRDLDPLRLSRAPLARVLCQARWPPLSKFNTVAIADTVAEIIGDTYPLRETHQEMQVTITPQGVTQDAGGKVYQFLTVDKEWTASLHDSFVTLETSAYTDHTDFVSRFADIFDSVRNAAHLPYLMRLGYRYTNRIVGQEDLDQLTNYFNPSVLGGLAQGRQSDLVHSITESVYRDGDHWLLVRSAMLEANAVIDPTLPPAASRSWLLDLDAYDEGSPSGYPIASVRSQALALAERARRRFRESITPEFIRRFE